MNKDIKKIVFSFGGSAIFQESPDLDYISEVSVFLEKLSEEYRIFIVTGGGRPARNYISAMRHFGSPESFLDMAGIMATRLNAMVFSAPLVLKGLTPPVIPENLQEAIILSKNYPIVVMGGSHPGHTTDAVASMLCEMAGADKFFNITNVGGVFDKDPVKDEGAKLISEMTFKELEEIVMTVESAAGMNMVIDPLALKILKRSAITAYVAGKDTSNLMNAIVDRPFYGTVIR